MLVISTSESLSLTSRMAVQPTVQLMFVSCTYRITELHYTYGSATLRAAYVGLPLGRESPGYTSVMGPPP